MIGIGLLFQFGAPSSLLSFSLKSLIDSCDLSKFIDGNINPLSLCLKQISGTRNTEHYY